VRQADRPDRPGQRAGIGEHVPGIGQQGQGPRHQRDHNLHDHEAGDQGEGDHEVADAGVTGRPVAVLVVTLARRLVLGRWCCFRHG
jgi:hypothetical protein